MIKQTLQFVKNLFSRREAGVISPFNKSTIRRVQGDPDDYERWETSDRFGIGSDSINPANDIESFLKVYQVNPWAYSCVQAIATAIASVGYRVTDLKDEEIKDKPIVTVISIPNPNQVWYEFVESSIIYLELAGEVFWEEVHDDKDNLIAVYPMRPDKIRIIPHPKVKIAGYIYEPRPGVEIIFGASEVTHIKYFSPLDEYRGLSPACAAANSLILNSYATSYNKAFFKNSAVPEGVLETDGSLSDQTYQRLRKQWHARHKGTANAFELAILEEGLKYKPIGFNQRDMQMAEMNSMTREDSLACWRVPPGVVGLLEHANYGNLREQKKMFYMDNIIPKIARIQQIANKNLMPAGTRIKFLVEEITAIVEDISVLTQVAMTLVSHGIWTINEVRQKLYNKKAVDWGKEPWLPVGLAQPSSGANAAMPPPGGTPDFNTKERNQDATKTQNQSTPMGGSMPRAKADFEKMDISDPDWNNPAQVRDWKTWSVWKGLATPDYKQLKSVMLDHFSKQMNRILPAIMSWYPIKEARKNRVPIAEKIVKEAYTDPFNMAKASMPSDIESTIINIMEDKKLGEVIVKEAKKIIKKHGTFTLGSLSRGIVFDMREKRIEKFLKKMGGEYIDDIGKTTRNILGNELSKAIKDGEGFDEMMERIQRVFKGDIAEMRARTIARTETVTLTQFARLEGAKQSGVAKKKRWVSELLDTTRQRPGGENHWDMHGVVKGIDEQFDVPNRDGSFDEMDGPGDPVASPENIVNCVCILDFPDTVEEFGDIDETVDEARRIAEEMSRADEKLRLAGISREKRDEEDDMRKSPVQVILNIDKMVNPPREPDTIKVEPIINIPESKPPDINVNVTIPKPERPIVKTTVEAPKVEVKPQINIEMPPAPVEVEKKETPIIVNVNPEIKINAKLKMPKRVEKTEVSRDERTGRVTGVTKTEETVDDDDEDEKNKGKKK